MRAIFISLLGVCAAGIINAAQLTATDDRGTQIALPDRPARIVALAPSVTELLFAAGAGEKIVGVARYSDFPAAAARIAQVGDASRIDLERVLSLRPDLVVAWKSGNHAADIESLERLGITVFVAEPETLAAISRLVRTFGMLAGTDAAKTAAAQFESGIAALGVRYKKRPAVRVFYEIWHEPLITVNGRHVISDVISLCGGSNIFSAVPVLTPIVSLESVMAAGPDVVLGGSSAMTPGDFSSHWRDYAKYAALRDVQARFVAPDTIQRQSLRLVEGAAAVCAHLDEIRSLKQLH